MFTLCFRCKPYTRGLSQVCQAVLVHRSLPGRLASAGFHVVNTLTAGAVAGAAFGAGTRNWKQVACFTGLFLSFFQLAKDSTFWIFFADPNGE
ncbi:hypothetical protein ABFS83_07G108000 [Erythranthe nasuta]